MGIWDLLTGESFFNSYSSISVEDWIYLVGLLSGSIHDPVWVSTQPRTAMQNGLASFVCRMATLMFRQNESA
jgi:hypothetical protein